MKSFACLYLLLFSALLSPLFAQDINSKQADKNENKIEELQSILQSLKAELKEKGADSANEIRDRLVRIEEKIDKLTLSVTNIENNTIVFADSGKGFDKATATAVLNMFAAAMAAEQKRHEAALKSKSKPSGSSSSNGPFYVVIESQRTLELARKAHAMLKQKGITDLALFYSLEYDFYYLTLPGVYSKSEKTQKINEWRAKGYEGTWWIAQDRVKGVEF